MSPSSPQSDAPFDPPEPGVFRTQSGLGLHYLKRHARGGGALRPGVVWLGGFRSDMTSTKAERLDEWAAAHGRAYMRFDYSGHGRSEGTFEARAIGDWFSESLEILRGLTQGPQILVGSSMGAWIALLVARSLAEREESDRLAGLVLIAPAVDFTQALLWPRMPPQARRAIEEDGLWLRPSDYSQEPYPITRRLIEDGRRWLLLDGEICAGAPVHILQGMQDSDVPWTHAVALLEHLACDPATLTLIKDGDHRLSREEDVARLISAIDALA